MFETDCNCSDCNPTLETYVRWANEFFNKGNKGCAYVNFMRAIDGYNDRDSYICVGIMYEKGWHVPQDYMEAIEYYTCAANRGAQDAQYRLGVIYYQGKPGVNIDYGKAFSWFQKASETTTFVPKLTWLDGAIPTEQMYSRDKAQYYLGRMYTVGKGVAVNQDMALYWFTKSAEKENAAAQYGMAYIHYIKNDSQQSKHLSLDWLRKSARNGLSDAQYILGVYNYFGGYFPKDKSRARYWFKRAIDTNGHPEALKCLTAMDRNQCVEFNNSPFFRHLKQSIASIGDEDETENEEDKVSQQDSTKNSLQELKDQSEQDNSDEQNKQGEELRDNQGDKRQSFIWFLKSANNGNSRGLYNMGKCYHEGTGVEMNPGQALYAFKLSANKGDIDAQFMVGEFYRHGYGDLSIDYALAESWYLKAAIKGHVKAQYELGNLYFLEEYKDKSVSKAFFWFSKASKHGNSDAQYKVGVCYLEGFGVQKDYYKARAEFLLAIENGNMDALLSIGMMYQQGLGFPRDYKEALKYYETAARLGHDEAFECMKDLQDIMRKEQNGSQKTIFKSGTEQYFHVGDLINALPDTDKIGESSSEKVRIIEERRRSAVFLRVEDHSVKVTDGREYTTQTTLNNDSKSTVYREKEAIFLHVEDTSVKVTEGRKQPPVFMHGDDTSSNVSEKNEQSPHFFHVDNTEIRVASNNMYDFFLANSRGGIYSRYR